MATGHWDPRWVDAAYLDYLADEARAVDDIHEQLLPLDDVGIGPDGQAARIAPYRARAVAGEAGRVYGLGVQSPR